MKRISHPPSSLNPWGIFGLAAGVLVLLALPAAAEDQPLARHPDERDGAATIIHRADVIRNRGTNGGNSAPMRLWPLLSTPEARMNYVEVAGPSNLHFHPDADHRLYVLEGSVVVTAGTNVTTATVGDLIIIPKGVRHSYDVPAKGDRALLLTFDAPPYDPRKTVNVGSTPHPPGEGPRKQ
jgi:quercetin dioxygenase-like cupin family protein